MYLASISKQQGDANANAAKLGRVPKNKQEEDFENMGLPEIKSKLKQVRSEIDSCNQQFAKFKKDGLMMKDKRVRDVLDKIAFLGFKERYLDSLRENKVPLKEKIPKTSQFYKHWTSREFMDQINTEIVKMKTDDVTNLKQVSRTINEREASIQKREKQNSVLRNNGK